MSLWYLPDDTGLSRWMDDALLAAEGPPGPPFAIGIVPCPLGGKGGGKLPKGELVNENVRAFMDGKIPLSHLTSEEIAKAITGYGNAEKTAKNAIHRDFQLARIRALLGHGPSPGSLKDFMLKSGQ